MHVYICMCAPDNEPVIQYILYLKNHTVDIYKKICGANGTLLSIFFYGK